MSLKKKSEFDLDDLFHKAMMKRVLQDKLDVEEGIKNLDNDGLDDLLLKIKEDKDGNS